MSQHNPLGDCRQCSGPLAQRLDVIACMWCGLPVPDHPLSLAATVPATVPRPAAPGSPVPAAAMAPAPTDSDDGGNDSGRQALAHRRRR